MIIELERSEDCYGMTFEERAEFENTWPQQPESDRKGYYIDNDVSNQAAGWAACAKLNREKIEFSQFAFDHTVAVRDAAERVESEACARIKDLEAENADLRVDAARLDFLEEAVPDFRDQVDRQMELEAMSEVMKGGG